ncbi:MAG: methionine--tRNA ligase [Candidatus Nanoarchaeia archaeon]|nr:methionine--tRNA ligase [Candidatus Nanoarchaeia archaeon]MDD5239333.1 methionine--tRNA ligase [Candidatus Nanoarchaeia archaeon]
MIVIKNILVCSAWPYAQAIPHLGNLVGCLLSGDVFARYYRLKGHKTLYVSGTDMHGTRAELEAAKKGITAEQLTKENHEHIKKIIKDFEIKFDNYTTTESVIHKEFVADYYKTVYENGYISTKVEKRAFCKNDKKFLADTFIEGECPYCGAKGAKGDQCDACGKLLEPEDLKNPICRMCGKSDVTFKETKHWFFDLKKLEPELKKYVKSHPEWQDNVKNFTTNFLNEGLKSRSITRDVAWGIPAPFEGAEDKTIWVWMEAALGYVSATKEVSEDWKEFWFGDYVKQIYAIGKDNIPFHTIVFPGQLIAAKEGYHLPDQIAATENLNWESNQKFSKSRGVGVFTDEALKLMPATHWRFYLLFDRPETKDTSFSWEELDKCVSQVLIGSISNLVNRALTFIDSKFNGKVPKAKLNAEDRDILGLIDQTAEVIDKNMEEGHLRLALDAVSQLANKVNAYFQKREPWKNEETKPNTLYVCAQICKALAIFLEPFLPSFSERLWRMLNIETKMSWDGLKQEIEPEHKINKPEILVEKIDIIELQKKYEALKK